MNGWEGRWVNSGMSRQIDMGWMGGSIDRQMNRWVNGGWKGDGWMCGRMDGWMD